MDGQEKATGESTQRSERAMERATEDERSVGESARVSEERRMQSKAAQEEKRKKWSEQMGGQVE